MAVRLRLRRTGTKSKPSYRVVAADQRSPRDGRFIEVLGFYDPRHNNENINLERAEYWLSNGAQPSITVNDIIRRAREGNALKAPEKAAPVALADLPMKPVEVPPPAKVEAPAEPAAEAVAEAAPEAPAAPEAEKAAE